MSDPDLERKIGKLSAKLDSFFFGFKVFLFLLLLAASLGNFMATFSVGTYQKFFTDTLSGKPLPGLTTLVLGSQTLLFILVLVWPTVGLIAVFIRRRIALPLLMFFAALICTSLQFAIVVTAMQMPMASGLVGTAPPNTSTPNP